MVREIVQYGHPVLRQRCRPVTEVDDTLRALLLSKSLAQNGYAAGSFLASLAGELQKGYDVLNG